MSTVIAKDQKMETLPKQSTLLRKAVFTKRVRSNFKPFLWVAFIILVVHSFPELLILTGKWLIISSIEHFVLKMSCCPASIVCHHYCNCTWEINWFNPSLANHVMPCLSKQCRSRSVKPTNLDLLFVIKYVNFYQNLGSSNLIDWKLEVGVAS